VRFNRLLCNHHETGDEKYKRSKHNKSNTQNSIPPVRTT
jgi:hypothetical protein